MFWKIVRRIFAFAFAIAAVLLLPAAMWISAAQGAFLNADTYKNGLAEQNIYDDLMPAVLPFLASESVLPQNIPFLQILSNIPLESRRAITDQLTPPTWLQIQLETGIDGFFTWLNTGSREGLNQPLDFSDFQARLRGDEGQRTIDAILNNAPPCSPQQIEQIQNFARGGSSPLPLCQPPEREADTLRSAMTQAMASVANHFEENPPTVNDFLNIRDTSDNASLPLFIAAVRQLLSIFYLIPAALLSLIVALVVRSFKSFGRWAGWMGIASAFIAILPLPVLANSIIASVTAEITRSPQSAETQLFFVQLATGLLSSGFAQFSAPVVAQALLLMILAGLLLIVPPMLARQGYVPVTLTVPDFPTVVAPVGNAPSTASQRRTGQINKPEDH